MRPVEMRVEMRVQTPSKCGGELQRRFGAVNCGCILPARFAAAGHLAAAPVCMQGSGERLPAAGAQLVPALEVGSAAGRGAGSRPVNGEGMFEGTRFVVTL